MKYRHKKTGNIYELINIANECNTEKFPRMAVYFSTVDGKVYARPFKDFINAFEFTEKINSPSTPQLHS